MKEPCIHYGYRALILELLAGIGPANLVLTNEVLYRLRYLPRNPCYCSLFDFQFSLKSSFDPKVDPNEDELKRNRMVNSLYYLPMPRLI